MQINESFVNVSELLKNKHVMNNDFFLKTLNPSADELDIFSPSLTDGEISIINSECEDNVWYFLRNIVRFKTADGGTTQYKLDLAKLASVYCCINNINNHIVTPRFTYNMHCSAAMMVWELLFGKDYNKIIINDIYNFGNLFFIFICDIIDSLPEYMAKKVIYDKENYTITRVDTGEIKLEASKFPVSKRTIEDIRNENKDNISVYPDFEIMAVTTDLLTSLPMETKSYSILPTEIIPDEMPEYDKIAMFVETSLHWEDWFYDLSIEAVKDKLRRDSLTNYIGIEYSYRELGYDDEWFINHAKLLNNDKYSVDRELLLKR